MRKEEYLVRVIAGTQTGLFRIQGGEKHVDVHWVWITLSQMVIIKCVPSIREVEP